jgi:hypothetical protein
MSTGSSGSGNAYSLKCLEEDSLLKNVLWSGERMSQVA